MRPFKNFIPLFPKKTLMKLLEKLIILRIIIKIITLTKDDIDFCKSKNLKYSIPIILEGEHMTHRTRTVIDNDDDDEEDDEEFMNE